VSSNRWHSEARTDLTTDRRWSVASVRHTGKSTNGWTALEYFRDRGVPVDRVVVFTDMQTWDSMPITAGDTRMVKAAFDAFRDEVLSNTSLYFVDPASYGDLVTPEGDENVYNVSGWSEDVLSFIAHAETSNQVMMRSKRSNLHTAVSWFLSVKRVVSYDITRSYHDRDGRSRFRRSHEFGGGSLLLR